jgi:cellulose synthase/poly-beta-1,6-N-acetylglucosamine synthase-like glycosyltransferase
MEIFVGALELTMGLCALGLLIPCAVFFLECVSAARRAALADWTGASFPRTTIVIPAHNEAAGIAATLASVQAAAFPQMDVLVVADHCADATADLARASGVRVVERWNLSQRGKDFAIAFGLAALRAQPPEVVIVLDADCVVAPDALRQLAVRARTTARPVQAAYDFKPPSGSAPIVTLAAFAFRVKNVVRPLGLRRWGAPCLLTGSGMAFPWQHVQYLSASGHLSEDMWWSVELTCAGYAPLFCPDAFVYGESPRRTAILRTQRARWERGHFATMRAGIPKLLRAALRERRAEPLWLAWELSVPPATLLGVAVVLLCIAAGLLFAMGRAPLPFALALLNLFLLAMAVWEAWWKFGRAEIPARMLLMVPWYVIWKTPLYVHALLRRRVVWTRTARESAASGET